MLKRPTILALAGTSATATLLAVAIGLAPGVQAVTGANGPVPAAVTPVDTTAPSVPTGLTVTIDCGNTVTLRWNASTDNVGVTGYDIYRTTGAGFTLLGVSTITTTTDRINGTTQYEVRARDAAGNVSAFSSVATIYPVGCPVPSPSPTPPSSGDTTPPTVPTGLGYRINCNLDVTLQWTASSDNVGVAGYDIFRATSGGTFAPVGTSTTTSFADHLGGVWQYEVRARDFAGNVSAFTAPVTVLPPPCPTMPPSSPPPSATSGGPDTQPPTVPGTPTATTSCGVANLTWTASTDNVAVYRYEVWRASVDGTFQLAATVPTNGYTQTGPGTYQFKVRAFDAANNFSAFSAAATVYVPACPSSSPPGTGCTASFSVVSAWTGGYQGQVTVTNTGTTPTTSWTVTLTLPSGQSISQIWNAHTSSTASPYTVTNETYNGALAPGASAAFGFLATTPGTGGSATTACTRTEGGR
jgi:hypothetical protein